MSTQFGLFIFPSDLQLFPDRKLVGQIDRSSKPWSGEML